MNTTHDTSTPSATEREQLVRDPDLRAEMDQARGKNGFQHFILPVLISRQEERDKLTARKVELDALPRETRRRAVLRESFEAAPPERADIRHLHSVLAICGLPHDRQPLSVRDYSREQGNMALDVRAGFLRDANGGKIIQPLPSGPKARLILMHLCSESVRQNSPTIEIADSFTAFVRDMGFSTEGGKRGTLTAFKEQLNALAACTMHISAWDGSSVKTRNFVPLEEIELWLSGDPNQRSLWPSTVTFSRQMYESLRDHAVPINVHAVKTFAGSSRKLDLYFWLGWRMNNIKAPLQIGWDALKPQFGIGFQRDRAFRAKFAEELGHILEVFPKLPVKISDTGLNLQPVDPDALALPPVPRQLKAA